MLDMTFGENAESANNAAVPEPQGVALMLAGLGVLGATAKRRRSQGG